MESKIEQDEDINATDEEAITEPHIATEPRLATEPRIATETRVVTEPHLVTEPRTVWESGCLHTDKEAVKFFCTYFLSLTVLTFSFYMIGRDNDDSQLALWSSIITSIASQYLPSPINEAKK